MEASLVDAGSGSSSTGTDKREGRHNGTPVLVVSVVLVVSAFAWQLIGAGVLVHILVLALGILVGALFHPRPTPADGPAAARATAAETAAGRSTHAGAPSRSGTPANGTDSPAAAAAAAAVDSRIEPLPPTIYTGGSIVPSLFGGGGGASFSGPAAASPLHWVGETVEGSINWLRGSNNNNSNNGECGNVAAGQQGSSNGHGATGDRRRRRRSRGSAGGGGASDPDGEAGGAFSSSGPTTPTTGAAARFGTGALPPLGEGIPHAQQQQQQQQPPTRARAWSRTLGLAGNGGQAAATATAGDALSMDAYDGDDSVDEGDEDEAGLLRGAVGAGAEDWMVGAGLGDTRWETRERRKTRICLCSPSAYGTV